MKTLLLFFLSVNTMAFGQTVVRSMQTSRGEKTLLMNIIGRKDGRSFHHSVRYDVSGMTPSQRDSLYAETVRALSIMGIRQVPGLGLPSEENRGPDTTGTWKAVTFICESCAKKGRLEIYGNDVTATRKIDDQSDAHHSFPMRIQLSTGTYQLVYYRKSLLKHIRQNQMVFTVKADSNNVIILP